MKVLMALTQTHAIRESLRAALPEQNLLIFESDIEAALRRLIATHVDVVILDDAPGLGLSALTRLRERFAHAPVIALSGRGDVETLATYKMAGAHLCLTKPFQCEELTRAVDEVGTGTPVAQEVSEPARYDSLASGPLHQYQMAMRCLSRALERMQDLSHLARTIVDGIVDVFDVGRAAVLLEENNSVRVVASHGLPDGVAESIMLTYVDGLMHLLERAPCVQVRDASGTPPEASKEMQLLGARLAAPLMNEGRVAGAILVGDKVSGQFFRNEERELLTFIARSCSAALAKARDYTAVAAKEHEFDTIFASMDAGVVIFGDDRRIAMMNESAQRLLQLDAPRVVGHSVQRLGSGFADVVLRVLTEGKGRSNQKVRDAATKTTLGLSVSPLRTGGAVAVFSPVPEIEENAEGLAYSPFWNYLAARVAQEIKNPMVAVNTYAQLLPTKYESEDFRQSFGEVVQQEVARINRVVETLFALAENPKLILEQRPLNDTVHGVLASFEEQLRQHNIDLDTTLSEDVGQSRMDPEQFSRALSNVVQNCIDAMPEGGQLHVHTEKDGDQIRVTVRDTGPGVTEEDAQRIFMPFFSTREKGMGLGLTMARQIMARHKGDLNLVQQDGDGASFTLHLPNSEAV